MAPAAATGTRGNVKISSWSNKVCGCAVAETQGAKDFQEDAHAVQLGYASGSFWVFDGHRGNEASQFGAKYLPQEIASRGMKGEYQEKCDNGVSAIPSDKKIEKCFAAVDRQLRQHVHHGNQSDLGRSPGSTVVGAFVTRQDGGKYAVKLVNCGDSRAVVIHGPKETRPGKVSVRIPSYLEESSGDADDSWDEDASWLPSWPAAVETIDHKPYLFYEKARIEAAGGKVTGGYKARLDGRLAVSRGLGDFDFKNHPKLRLAEQKISCLPDIYKVKNLKEGSLVLLASDGLWDVMSTEEVVDFVRCRVEQFHPLSAVVENLIDTCLDLGSGDNVTVLLVQCSFDGAREHDDRRSV